MGRLQWLCIATGLALLPAFFVTFTGTLRAVLVSEVYPLAHLFWFAAMTVALRPLAARSVAPRTLTLGVGLAVGLAIELLQDVLGRSATVEDLLGDLAGICLGLAFTERGLNRLPPALVGISLAAMTTGPAMLTLAERAHAAWRFPILGNFETPGSDATWRGGERSAAVAHTGRHSLRLALWGPAPEHRRRAASLLQPGDWRGYDRLDFAVHCAGACPLALNLSIGDAAHGLNGSAYGDRYDATFAIDEGWNDFSIPLSAVAEVPSGRTMNLGEIRRFVLFTTEAPRPVVLHVDDLRLRQRRD